MVGAGRETTLRSHWGGLNVAWVVYGDGWAAKVEMLDTSPIMEINKIGFMLSLFLWQGKRGVCGKADKSKKKKA